MARVNRIIVVQLLHHNLEHLTGKFTGANVSKLCLQQPGSLSSPLLALLAFSLGEKELADCIVKDAVGLSQHRRDCRPVLSSQNCFERLGKNCGTFREQLPQTNYNPLPDSWQGELHRWRNN